VEKQWREAVVAYEELQKIYPQTNAHLPYKRYLEMAREGLAKAEGGTSATTAP
jgi:hypothetical protein